MGIYNIVGMFFSFFLFFSLQNRKSVSHSYAATNGYVNKCKSLNIMIRTDKQRMSYLSLFMKQILVISCYLFIFFFFSSRISMFFFSIIFFRLTFASFFPRYLGAVVQVNSEELRVCMKKFEITKKVCCNFF